MVHARTVEGAEGEAARTLTFGVSGKLLDEVLVIYDRETGSEWSHLTGACLGGPLAGRALERVAGASMLTFGEWVRAHPETDVLAPIERLARYRAHAARYADYHERRRGEMVLGVIAGEESRAYRLADLACAGFVNDELGEDEPVLVYHDSATGTALAWSRSYVRESSRELGSVYTSVLVEVRGRAEHAPGEVLLVDQHDCLWEPLTGTCVAGECEGGRMEPLAATPSYEYGWRAYYPDSTWWSPTPPVVPRPAPGRPSPRLY